MIFCLKVYVTGAMFVLCDRMFLIQLKDTNLEFAAVLAFSSGFVGIISIFNFERTVGTGGEIISGNSRMIENY